VGYFHGRPQEGESGISPPAIGPKNLEGPKCSVLGEQQDIFGDTASQSEK